jgi:hypothetical protein
MVWYHAGERPMQGKKKKVTTASVVKYFRRAPVGLSTKNTFLITILVLKYLFLSFKRIHNYLLRPESGFLWSKTSQTRLYNKIMTRAFLENHVTADRKLPNLHKTRMKFLNFFVFNFFYYIFFAIFVSLSLYDGRPIYKRSLHPL